MLNGWWMYLSCLLFRSKSLGHRVQYQSYLHNSLKCATRPIANTQQKFPCIRVHELDYSIPWERSFCNEVLSSTLPICCWMYSISRTIWSQQQCVSPWCSWYQLPLLILICTEFPGTSSHPSFPDKFSHHSFKLPAYWYWKFKRLNPVYEITVYDSFYWFYSPCKR